MSLPSRTDVLIVGAGPAGSTLAYHLAKSGVDPALIDRAEFPRSKTCGGGVSYHTLRLLPFDISPVIEETIHSITFSRHFADLYTRRYPEPILVTVQRKNFDHFLIEQAVKAGARFFGNTRFQSWTSQKDTVEVETTAGKCQAKFLVGADGVQSAVAGTVRLGGPKQQILVIHSEVPTSVFPWSEPETVHVDWGSHKRAYAYLFPRRETLAIGAGGLGYAPSDLKKYHQAFLHNQWQKEAAFPFSAAGFLLPLRKREDPIQKGRCLLVGDAAALLDPFTGEGIYGAIRSAILAAAVLEEKLKTGDDSLNSYQDAINRDLMPELEWSKLLREIFNLRPSYFHRKIASNDRWWNAMVKILRGERTTVDVKRRIGLLGKALHSLVK